MLPDHIGCLVQIVSAIGAACALRPARPGPLVDNSRCQEGRSDKSRLPNRRDQHPFPIVVVTAEEVEFAFPKSTLNHVPQAWGRSQQYVHARLLRTEVPDSAGCSNSQCWNRDYPRVWWLQCTGTQGTLRQRQIQPHDHIFRIGNGRVPFQSAIHLNRSPTQLYAFAKCPLAAKKVRSNKLLLMWRSRQNSAQVVLTGPK